jgi:hypothetical protein
MSILCYVWKRLPYTKGKTLQEPEYSDDVKRLSASVNLHAFLGNAGLFAAYKLQDISTDNVAYPSRSEAVRILWPRQEYYFFVCISPGGMTHKEAESFLRYNRELYSAGFRMPDPDLVESIPTMPNTRADARKQIRMLTKR